MWVSRDIFTGLWLWNLIHNNTVMQCVTWHPSIRTTINSVSNLSFSSSCCSLPTCINELCLHITLLLVNHCCWKGHRRGSFEDTLTQPSRHLSLFLVKLRLDSFSCFNSSNKGKNVSYWLIYPTQQQDHNEEPINDFYLCVLVMQRFFFLYIQNTL